MAWSPFWRDAALEYFPSGSRPELLFLSRSPTTLPTEVDPEFVPCFSARSDLGDPFPGVIAWLLRHIGLDLASYSGLVTMFGIFSSPVLLTPSVRFLLIVGLSWDFLPVGSCFIEETEFMIGRRHVKACELSLWSC